MNKLKASYTPPQPGVQEQVVFGPPGTLPQVSSQVICAQKSSHFALVDRWWKLWGSYTVPSAYR